MRIVRVLASVVGFAVLPFGALAQSMTYAEVKATGAKPMPFVEVVELVSGAHTEFILASGSRRTWTNHADGSLLANRNSGPMNRRTGRGTWSVNDDAAYCLSFDWGSMETEEWCRRMYRVDDRYYAFSLKAKPDVLSGQYIFKR
jgi:hypothetical protein